MTGQRIVEPPSPPAGWQGLSGAEAGENHLVSWPPVPCQDACTAVTEPRPLLLVADGIGSRPLSHLGAEAVVRLVPCFLAGNEEVSRALLDGELPPDAPAACQRYARGIVRFADAVLKDLAGRLGHEDQAVQCTLLLAVAGTAAVFWLQVGDGAIVFEGPDHALSAATVADKTGDPSVTEVVRTAVGREMLTCGLVDATAVTGIAAFSDGAGERLVSADGTEVAGVLRKWFGAVRARRASRLELRDFLRDPHVWERTTGDDRSLALLAKAS